MLYHAGWLSLSPYSSTSPPASPPGCSSITASVRWVFLGPDLVRMFYQDSTANRAPSSPSRRNRVLVPHSKVRALPETLLLKLPGGSGPWFFHHRTRPRSGADSGPDEPPIADQRAGLRCLEYAFRGRFRTLARCSLTGHAHVPSTVEHFFTLREAKW